MGKVNYQFAQTRCEKTKIIPFIFQKTSKMEKAGMKIATVVRR